MKSKSNLDTDEISRLVLRLELPSMPARFVSVFDSIVNRIYIGDIWEEKNYIKKSYYSQLI